MAFPTHRAAMIEQSYIHDNDGECRGCSAPIEWWITPNGSKLCMNPMLHDNAHAQSHWATCPAREQFRKPKAKTPAQPQPAKPQGSLF